MEVRLTGRAAHFLDLLHDFGHLDEEGVAQVMLAVGEAMEPEASRADLPEVRRAAAAVLFDRSDGSIDGLLQEDWAMLFS